MLYVGSSPFEVRIHTISMLNISSSVDYVVKRIWMVGLQNSLEDVLENITALSRQCMYGGPLVPLLYTVKQTRS